MGNHMRYTMMAAGAVFGIFFLLLFFSLFLRKKLESMKKSHILEMEELKKRLEEEYSVRVVDKQAKLSALQSQINPHFLYNTLECIRSEALLYDCDSIARMAKALASFFRYSISKKESIVTIQDELHNIENYFLIQSYRFDDKFSYEIIVSSEDQEVYSYLIPKMSLQPIVENAIFHGLETKASDGKITIRLKTTGQHVLLVVSDNGVGIERERLEQMKESLKGVYSGSMPSGESGNGIALANVSQRIRLIFGDDYGLNLYSTKGIGTDVEILLPIFTDRLSL